MNSKPMLYLIALLILAIGGVGLSSAAAPLLDPPSANAAAPNPFSADSLCCPSPHAATLADNPLPPASPVKLIFIHHSTGGNWLADPALDQPYGGLGIALMNNNYFVSATNYDWGPDSIGSRTDIPNWPEWFTGPNSATILSTLYAETGQNIGGFGDWSRLATDPGGENEIVMFKSCFPNSDLYGNPNDPPLPEPNDQYTVENAKAVYNKILAHFATRQDKLFVVITAPPMAENEYTSGEQTPAQRAANARAFSNWLVNDWLKDYPYNNVAVFDYHNVLTSNGSVSRIDDPTTTEEPNDAGSADGNHHRWWNDAIQHIQTISNNFAAYPSGDSHPTAAGHQKATVEFVPLLNVFYNRWKSGAAPASLNITQPDSATRWPISSTQQIRWTTIGTVTHVNLAYATSGVTATFAAGVANMGVYTWTTPPTPTAGASARVRVESAVSPTIVYDVSDAFTLYDPSVFTNTVYLPLVSRNWTGNHFDKEIRPGTKAE
jgi:hypothetical protein